MWQTPLHGHRLRTCCTTPPTDTTNGRAHNNSTTNLPRRNARAQHLDMSRRWDVANFCPLVVSVGGVRSLCPCSGVCHMLYNVYNLLWACPLVVFIGGVHSQHPLVVSVAGVHRQCPCSGVWLGQLKKRPTVVVKLQIRTKKWLSKQRVKKLTLTRQNFWWQSKCWRAWNTQYIALRWQRTTWRRRWCQNQPWRRLIEECCTSWTSFRSSSTHCNQKQHKYESLCIMKTSAL